MLHSGKPGRRRERHHWDKISALQIVCFAARYAPRRYKKGVPEELENVLLFKDMTYDQVQKYRTNGGKKGSAVTKRSRYRRRK